MLINCTQYSVLYWGILRPEQNSFLSWGAGWWSHNWLVTNIRRSDNIRDNRQPSVTLSRCDETQAPESVSGDVWLSPWSWSCVCVLAIIMKRWWLRLWNTRSQGGCKSEMLLECLALGRWTCSCGFVWTPETLHKMVSDSSWSDEIWATRPSGYNHRPDLDPVSDHTRPIKMILAVSWLLTQKKLSQHNDRELPSTLTMSAGPGTRKIQVLSLFELLATLIVGCQVSWEQRMMSGPSLHRSGSRLSPDLIIGRGESDLTVVTRESEGWWSNQLTHLELVITTSFSLGSKHSREPGAISRYIAISRGSS